MGNVSDVLHAALSDARYDTLRAAVAYATSSGVREIQDAVAASNMTIKWLSAFDWCRSEPAALNALAQKRASEVRIHDGVRVVARSGCVPTVSFHPKSFLFSGPTDALLVLGSANLSRNGLRHGVEFDASFSASGGAARDAEWRAINRSREWFDSTWEAAAPYRALADRYEVEYSKRSRATALLEFGVAGLPAGRSFTPQQLALVAGAQSMWIEAGNLTAAGAASPGHQLMMRPMSRVYFGFGADAVPRMTRIGEVSIDYDGALTPGLSLEFAHNSMDRLNLPATSRNGVTSYDGTTLRFDKTAVGGGLVFNLKVVRGAEEHRLRSASSRLGMSFTMSSGRSFGFV